MSNIVSHPHLQVEVDDAGKAWVRGDFDGPYPGESDGGEFRSFHDMGYVVLVHDTPLINEAWMVTPPHALQLAAQLIRDALAAIAQEGQARNR